jgi:hypothetical protein
MPESHPSASLLLELQQQEQLIYSQIRELEKEYEKLSSQGEQSAQLLKVILELNLQVAELHRKIIAILMTQYGS